MSFAFILEVAQFVIIFIGVSTALRAVDFETFMRPGYHQLAAFVWILLSVVSTIIIHREVKELIKMLI